MRENRPSGSEGGGAELNRSSLPLSLVASERNGSVYSALPCGRGNEYNDGCCRTRSAPDYPSQQERALFKTATVVSMLALLAVFGPTLADVGEPRFAPAPQPAVATAGGVELTFAQQQGSGDSPWHLVAGRGGQQSPGQGPQLWAMPLPAELVRWGMAIDGQGRIIVALRNGQILGFGAAKGR